MWTYYKIKDIIQQDSKNNMDEYFMFTPQFTTVAQLLLVKGNKLYNWSIRVANKREKNIYINVV